MSNEIEDTKKCIEMAQKLLSAPLDDLLTMLRESPNIRIRAVIESAYKAACKDRLNDAINAWENSRRGVLDD